MVGTRWLELPVGAAGGILAGSQTMSAAVGSAEQAITSGVVHAAAGSTREAVTAMIALSYGITYIWGTVGIILISKYLPRWWRVDAREAVHAYELAHGVPNLDDAGLSGYGLSTCALTGSTTRSSSARPSRSFANASPSTRSRTSSAASCCWARTRR
ncbi:hypothetical protein WKW80_10830 [Variovorax humicola]|uniref:YidE/YbjL duplication domain-containing protein n=1 Tax=Variovorax humicola TaxID=1769758 RepID=A0ABU8VYR6_9BURK